MKRFAIIVGCTKVDPDAYGGWDGRCPGVDVDVHRVAEWCGRSGFDAVTTLRDAAATKAMLLPVFEEQTTKLEPGDLLWLYFSGHGGQQPDLDGDEWDGRDETLCLHDGELVDDTIAIYLAAAPPGVRIVFVTDCCHAGTNFRGRRSKPRKIQQTHKLNERAVSQLATGTSLVHWGGCTDSRYSYGDVGGGDFTIAMLDVLRRARIPLNYHMAFERIVRRLPKSQQPSMALWGSPTFEMDEVGK